MTKVKSSSGRFLEDFVLGETISHATPRTLTSGDASLYTALYGNRFALQSSDPFAEGLGYQQAPLDDLLVFHTVFGKTVPDISLNAVANLGYAGGVFLGPVYPGDTLNVSSDVIGLKESSNGKTGVVYVHSKGFNQHSQKVVEFFRWVLVNKRDPNAQLKQQSVPELVSSVNPQTLGQHLPKLSKLDQTVSGSPFFFDDYEIGERIDHIDGMSVEESEHQLATRLYQNTARVHFDQHLAAQGRFGKRLIYGGHVISLARSLSFNGLANVHSLAAINGGRHVAPLFAGNTVYAWSEVLDKATLPNRPDYGAIRLRLVATKNQPCSDFPFRQGDDYAPDVILDLDYWAFISIKP